MFQKDFIENIIGYYKYLITILLLLNCYSKLVNPIRQNVILINSDLKKIKNVVSMKLCIIETRGFQAQ